MNNCDLLNFRFVDRIEAKKTLHDFINGTSAAPVLWISGEQGIGITRLIKEVISKNETETIDAICSFKDDKDPSQLNELITALKKNKSGLGISDFIRNNYSDVLDITKKISTQILKLAGLDTIGEILCFAYTQIEKSNTDYKKNSAIRNAAVLELLFATGARVAEICNLHSQDVDFIGKSVKLYGKGSKERIIPIENTSVLTILSDYYFIHEEKISDCGYFFVNKYGKRLTEQSVRCMINSYCQTCGISMHITPHMFRHSFATLLLEQDVDIRYIQKLLGHSSITTTQIYTHVTSAKQKEIIKTKHPRNNLNIN